MFANGGKKVKAYIYNLKGCCSPPIYIGIDPTQIASFIVKTQKAPKIIITDCLDDFELDTMYGFVDKCVDKDFLDKLLDILIPMQEGNVKPEELEILSWGVNEIYNKDNIMLPFIKENFLIEL